MSLRLSNEVVPEPSDHTSSVRAKLVTASELPNDFFFKLFSPDSEVKNPGPVNSRET